jgi:PAS domain S-box-containing protein/diguanylate cyclase (GGDEF)-like protein
MDNSSFSKKFISDTEPHAAGEIDYAAAVDTLPAGVVVTDPNRPDNPVIFVNPAFTKLTGYSPEECVGRNCRFLQGIGTDRNAISEIGAAISRGVPIRREILNYRKDGTEFWNDLAVNPVMDASGRITSFVGVQTDVTERRREQAKRREAESQVSRIVENMPGFVFRRILTPSGEVQYLNSHFDRVDWKSGSPITFGKYQNLIMHPDDEDAVREAVIRSIADCAPSLLEFRVIAAGGEHLWFRTHATPQRNSDGETIWDGVGIDISREKASENRLASVVNNMPGYIFQRVRRPDGKIEFPYVSPSFSRMIGDPGRPLSSSTDIFEHVHPEDLGRVRSSIDRSAADLSPLEVEYRLARGDNTEAWIRTYSTPRSDSNGDVVWDCVAVDITNEKAIELRLAYLVHHDPMTGLANRALLTERLTAAIMQASESGGEVALFHLAISDFSEINETLGMDDADMVLKGLAARFNEVALSDRETVVARMGNSEFAILRQGDAVAGQSAEFVEVLMRNVAQPILIGNDAVAVEVCAGTTTFIPGELGHLSAGAAATEMFKRAAIALSAAAKIGPGAHRLYSGALDHRTRHRMMLRHSMRHAIEHDEFELHYQPLVDLESGSIVSAEALIRWRHPELGLLRPDLFISLAEETGLIGALGEWVMRRAMRQMREWESKGLDPPKIALNVSGVEIGMPGFMATVRRSLLETGGDARKFELELTEGFLLEHSKPTLSVLAELKSLGFELAIDDFGAGHSNFQYLRSFPVDKLKIDQIFVRQLVADSNDALIIRAIASLARSLKLGLVAEGIETAEQREFLRDQGCPIGQGYFFSLPLTAEDFGWMIENRVVLPITPPKGKISTFEKK